MPVSVRPGELETPPRCSVLSFQPDFTGVLALRVGTVGRSVVVPLGVVAMAPAWSLVSPLRCLCPPSWQGLSPVPGFPLWQRGTSFSLTHEKWVSLLYKAV